MLVSHMQCAPRGNSAEPRRSRLAPIPTHLLMTRSLERQAQALYRTLGRLLRQYQFRDRAEISCHGVSVSQCYALSMLQSDGPCTMSDVAGALCLDLSTITRLADQLEERGLIQRTSAENDRRVCRMRLTPKGSTLVRSIESELVAEYRAVLQGLPAASREAVLAAIEGLGEAFEKRTQRKQ